MKHRCGKSTAWATAALCLVLTGGTMRADDPERLDGDLADEAADVAALVDDVEAESPYRLAMFEALQQPPAASPATSLPSRGGRSASRTAFDRLARSPNMFGDSQLLTYNLQSTLISSQPSVASFFSNAAGSRKIAENDKVMPMDRVFFNFNEFHGMAPPLAVPFAPPASSQFSRFTLGGEKTFFDGTCSAEARLAIANSPQMSALDTQYLGGTPTGLTFYFKKLCYWDSTTAFGAGLGVGVPVTSDVTVVNPLDTLRYRERTTHLMPYVGFLSLPTDNWFFQGFLQLDFAAGQNQLDVAAPEVPPRELASVAEQHLLFADLALGRWLMRNDAAPFLSGIAGVMELHYVSTLNNSQPVISNSGPVGPTYTLSNMANRQDVLNLTAGLQFQFGQLSNLRVAAVAPLTAGFNRFFDGELQVSFNRQF